MKNLKLLLQNIDDLGVIDPLAANKNNILDIRRCIVQYNEQKRINSSAKGGAMTELILDSILLKF